MKISKRKADYRDRSDGHFIYTKKCIECIHYISSKKTGIGPRCQMVDGVISPMGTCKLWKLNPLESTQSNLSPPYPEKGAKVRYGSLEGKLVSDVRKEDRAYADIKWKGFLHGTQRDVIVDSPEIEVIDTNPRKSLLYYEITYGGVPMTENGRKRFINAALNAGYSLNEIEDHLKPKENELVENDIAINTMATPELQVEIKNLMDVAGEPGEIAYPTVHDAFNEIVDRWDEGIPEYKKFTNNIKDILITTGQVTEVTKQMLGSGSRMGYKGYWFKHRGLMWEYKPKENKAIGPKEHFWCHVGYDAQGIEYSYCDRCKKYRRGETIIGKREFNAAGKVEPIEEHADGTQWWGDEPLPSTHPLYKKPSENQGKITGYSLTEAPTTGKMAAEFGAYAATAAIGSITGLVLYHTALSPKVSASKSYQRLLITVPHARCNHKDNPRMHLCDQSAKEFAKSLYRSGDKLMIGDMNRSEIDYNRIESIGTEWHTELTELMKSKTYDFLIDAHSFPETSERYGGNDVVILYNYFSTGVRQVAESIRKALEKYSFKVEIRESIMQEDFILSKSVALGISGLLIEVSEKLTESQLNRVAQTVRFSLPRAYPAANEGAEGPITTTTPPEPVDSDFMVHAITYSCSGAAETAEIGLCAAKNPKSNLWRHEWKKNNPGINIKDEKITGRVKVKNNPADIIGKVDVKSNGIGDYHKGMFEADEIEDYEDVIKEVKCEGDKCVRDSEEPTRALGHLIKIEYLKKDGSSFPDGAVCSGSSKPCNCGKKVKEWIPSVHTDVYTNKEGSALFLVKVVKAKENPVEGKTCPTNLNNLGDMLVFWHMKGCSHCAAMEPYIEKCGIPVLKIDAMTCENIADLHKITDTPTLYLYRGDKLVKKHVGQMSESELKRWVKR